MLKYPHFNPVAFQVGPLEVHWYGIMYLIAFLVSWYLLWYRAEKPHTPLERDQVSDLVLYAALGVLIGGRTGYMLFYDLPNFLHNPLIIFRVWDGGMSFHGGLLGVLLAMWLYARKIHQPLWAITDFIVPVVPIGLGLGRLGNFINGELWGRVTNVPWAMVFPTAGRLPRHPSSLYEFFLEGVALFLILWFFSSKPRPRFAVSALFVLGYGCFRFFCEFFRQPDPQLGFIAFGWVTMGQTLSAPMIVIGAVGLWWIYRRKSGKKTGAD